MSRHRNVRALNFTDEYDGYDDIYGHSVEDEYSISPSDAAEFMYDRTRQPQMSAFFDGGEDIIEEDESGTGGGPQRRDSTNYKWPRLSDVDEARLRSCLEEIRNVVGDCVPEHVLVETVLKCGFDVHRALDQVLRYSQAAAAAVEAPTAADGPKPQRQRRERNRERDDDDDDSSPACFLDVRPRVPTTRFLKQCSETLRIRNSNNKNLGGCVRDRTIISVLHKCESSPPSSKTTPNQFIEPTSIKNIQHHVERVLNKLNVIANSDSGVTLPVNSKFHSEDIMAHDSQMSFDNFLPGQQAKESHKLSIPKFQMKIRRDSDKENDQECLHSSLKIQSNIEEFSPPLSDDEDGGGLSSLSALARQHQSVGHEVKSPSLSFRTVDAPGMILGLKVGQRALEDSEVQAKVSEEKCFNSLADLIASHLSTSDGPRRPQNGHVMFPSLRNTSLSTTGSDSGSCSPVQEVDDVVIDLTCALKTNAVKFLEDDDKMSEREETLPVFLDLDEELELVVPEVRRLSCHMSASNFLQQTFALHEQESSSFGKMLCKKWRRLPVPRVLHRAKSVHTIKHFTFDSLSPDDENIKNRLRK